MVEPTNQYDEDKATHARERKLPIIEVFGPTIQGEGAMIGVKTMFVRMGGCDFRCTKCDSLHAVIPAAVKKNRTLMTQQQIAETLAVAKVDQGVEWVTLSGGNPAMWDLEELVMLCHQMGMKVAVETQATIWHDWIGYCDQITLSPKSPGMGERFNAEVFGTFLGELEKSSWWSERTCLKIVCFDQVDLEFALNIGKLGMDLGISNEALYLSVGNPYPPVLDGDNNLCDNPAITEGGLNLRQQLMADYRIMLEDYLQDPRFVSWKFLPQLHVVIWGNEPGV